MCGIVGILLNDGRPISTRERCAIRAAMDAIGHRGPDARGFYESDSFAVGHVRLSILDIEGGAQPFVIRDKSAVLAYNGELYDFFRLRSELGAAHSLATRSDTEVMAYLLKSSGIAGLERVNGMYAFAFYEVTQRRLTLAVDPVGIKPLYYVQTPELLAFCSELAPLCLVLRELGKDICVNEAALPLYLNLGWFPAPATAVQGILKLLPGESLVRDASGSVERTRRRLPPPDAGCRSLQSSSEWKERARAVLTDAINSQLIADVPVGLFLSGGVDSSLLLALASKAHAGLMTFSAGFADPAWGELRFDESVAAAAVAHRFGSQHHELQITPGMLIDCIDDVLRALDEPIADPAVLPLHCLSRFTRQHVKVCLTGDGGDELFGGYAHHLLRKLWLGLNRVAGSGAMLNAACWIGTIGERLKLPGMRRNNAALTMLASMGIVRGPFSGSFRNLLPEQLRHKNVEVSEATLADPDALLRFELEWSLAGYMLPKIDRITMHSSLEARVPYLDNRVIALARVMPWSEKVRLGRSKMVLRDLLANEMPGNTSNRRKLGFRVPLDSWFRGALRSRAQESFAAHGPLLEVLQGSAAQLLALHTSGRESYGSQLWTLTVLDSWLRRIREMGPDRRTAGPVTR